MQNSNHAVVIGGAVALALAAAPALARVGVEETASPAPVAAAEAPQGEPTAVAGAGWDDSEGGFHLGKGDFKLVVGGRLQPGFTYISWPDEITDEDTATFQLRRARFYLLGNFMGEENTYYVQFGADQDDAFWESGGTDGDVVLFDAWLKHSFSSSFYLKGGQFKTPYSRQLLTSSGKLQLPYRSLAAQTQPFNLRDVGVEIGGGMSEDSFQWSAALVNGNGPNELNADDRLGFYGRFVFNPTGNYGYSEGDVENSDTLASTIGISGHYQKDPNEDAYSRIAAEGGIKYRGWGFQGEYYWTRVEYDLTDEDESMKSFYLQGGFFIDPKTIELVARVSGVAFEGDDNDESEYTAGINWFWKGHRLKWQTAYSYYDSQALEDGAHRLTTQAQIWF